MSIDTYLKTLNDLTIKLFNYNIVSLENTSSKLLTIIYYPVS